ESVTADLQGNEVTLDPVDVMVSVQQASDWASADADGIQVALSTSLTPELEREGMARDLIRHIQQLRKDTQLEENDRITIQWSADSTENLTTMLTEWESLILTETRANGIQQLADGNGGKSVSVGGVQVQLSIQAGV
ncbi:MAG: isoleucine--tRNA ligase, partial [Planctomycetaceae bacterium]|nr:isoleucine--tRNA ligase [Planctomycetaceae bacterium]